MPVLGPVKHRSPCHLIDVAEPQELEAGFGQHGVKGGTEEVGDEDAEHVGDNMAENDAPAAFTRHPRRLDEGPVPQRNGLRSQHPGAPRPAREGEDEHYDRQASLGQVGRDDDQEDEARGRPGKCW